MTPNYDYGAQTNYMLFLFFTIIFICYQYNHLGVKEILTSFRLVLKGKTGKGIFKSSRLELIEMFLANNFALSDGENNTFKLLNKEGIKDLPLQISNYISNCISNLLKALRATFLGCETLVLLVYAGLTASRTLLQWLLAACLNFAFKRITLMVQTKKANFMRYDNTTTSWRPWKLVRVDLTFTMRDIYINCNMNPLKEFTSNSRSTNFKYILLRNISRMITETIPISTRIVITYVMKWGITFWVWWKSMETDKTWLKFPNGEKTIVEQILASEEINKSKQAGLCESQSENQVGKLTI